jgi:hypothetical protein
MKRGLIRSASNKKVRIFMVLFASPVRGIKITAPIVLAQHKGHERISEARKRFRHASPIGMKIA